MQDVRKHETVYKIYLVHDPDVQSAAIHASICCESLQQTVDNATANRLSGQPIECDHLGHLFACILVRLDLDCV